MTTYGWNMLTLDRLRELLGYDESSGELTWKTTRRGRRAGVIAGTDNGRYLQVTVDYRIYLVHRVVWFYVNGVWPVGQIDHINGDKKDNRICNLRDVVPSVNQQNQRRPQRSNATGLLGVVPVRKKFRAQITIDGKSRSLGTYLSADEAHAAYINAKRIWHEGCTI